MSTLIPILDTHQHLIYPGQLTYSWTGGIEQLANKRFELDDYLSVARDQGVAGSIFMETAADNWPNEAAFVTQLAEKPNSGIVGIVANARPEDVAFDAYLESVKTNVMIVGLRRILHVEPDERSADAIFVKNVQKLAASGLTFDLCVLGRQLPVGLRLVRRCPEVQFILDHCGVPDIAGSALAQWKADLSDIAQCPNVACKVSGLPTYAVEKGLSVETFRPYVEHCVEQFGFDRLVWGGDWPVVNINSSLPAWISMTRELFADASMDEQKKLYHRNAERIYGVTLSPQA